MRTFPARAAALLALALLLSGKAAAQGQVAMPTNSWVTMRPPGQGFRILVPPDWDQGTPRGPNVKLLVRSTAASNAGRIGVANCNVVARAQPETRNRTQASINAEVRSEGPLSRTDALDMIGILQDGELLESRISAVSGIPALFVVARGRYENVNVTTVNTIATLLVFQSGRIHAATCATAATDGRPAEASWTSWRPTVMAILGTFVLENY